MRRPGQGPRQEVTDSGLDKEPEGGGKEGKTVQAAIPTVGEGTEYFEKIEGRICMVEGDLSTARCQQVVDF